MIEINLIPDVKQELLRAQTQRAVVISVSITASIIALGLVAAVLAYVFGVQTVRSSLLDNSIKSESQKLSSVEDLSKVLTIQNQLTKINEINDQKKVNSRVFDMLAAVIPPAPNNIQVSNLLAASETKAITIEGQAPSFEALETFKKTLAGATIVYRENGEEKQEQLATSISTTDVSYGEDTGGRRVLRFTMNFSYPDMMFSPKAESLLVRLNNQGNATDSFLGIPKSIFAPRASDEGSN